MKIIGALLVMVAGTGAGWIYSLLLKKRVEILSSLIQCFQWLETEVGYATVPLAEAFGRISGRVEAETGLLFSGFTAELNSEQGLTADEAWQQSLAKCQDRLALQREDWALLEDFGRTLGSTDREHQLNAIRQTLEKLKLQAAAAVANREKNERLYRYLGMAGSALIVLLFY
jgi:stage III sporulation protein AB